MIVAVSPSAESTGYPAAWGTTLPAGDVSVTEYYVCAEYRRESDTLLQNGGEVTPDKTPLVFLGRAARAPWYNFDGVLR